MKPRINGGSNKSPTIKPLSHGWMKRWRPIANMFLLKLITLLSLKLWWYVRSDQYNPQGWVDIPVYQGGGFRPYTNAVYFKGAHFLDDLRSLIGDDTFFAFLQDYLNQENGKIATSADFFRILRTPYTNRSLRPDQEVFQEFLLMKLQNFVLCVLVFYLPRRLRLALSLRPHHAPDYNLVTANPNSTATRRRSSPHSQPMHPFHLNSNSNPDNCSNRHGDIHAFAAYGYASRGNSLSLRPPLRL